MNKKTRLGPATAILTALLPLVAIWIALHAATTAAKTPLNHRAVNPGDVVINEIAWMGTAADYLDEWIELHNTTAAPITLTGWTLVADDGTPSILLNGVIPSQGYFLLERIDDNSIIDIPADQIYSGALENNPNAESLRLHDDSSKLIDIVNADGGGWPAGTNDTKQTMERKDPLADGGDGNWANNDGITRNGQDAAGQPVNGTPRARNSAYAGPSMPEADLVVTKSGSTTAQAGGVVTYTIRLSNSGALTATGVRLTDSLPAAVTFITATSDLPVDHSRGLLSWAVGEMPNNTPPLLITVTGLISPTASGVINNAVTATTKVTETIQANNRATWETTIAGGMSGSHVLIAALLYDGYQTRDQDEAVQLVNVSDTPTDLTGWQICDAPDGGTCSTIVSGTLGAREATWLAYWASDFYTSSGFYPAYAVKGLVSETFPLSGSWPRYANTGEQVVLRDPGANIIDTLVYGDGGTGAIGWSGAAVHPWTNAGLFGAEGQILYRRLDEETGLPVPDTDTAADWAQYAADPVRGRRVRYPGWDLESLFHPLTVTEDARLTVGVAPDNAADVVLSAISSAQREIEIAVYALRHPTIISELVDKAQSGITVTVLLEGDLTGVSKNAPRWYQEMWACQQLQQTGHGTCWFMISDDQANIFDRYRYMHAKYVLIDREKVLVSTQNLTASGMPDDDRSNGTYGSRGVVLLTDAPSVVARVAQVFDYDLDPAHHADLLAWSSTGSEYGPPPSPPIFTPALSVTDYTTYTVVFSQPLTIEGTFAFELFTAPEASLRQTDALLGLLARAGDGGQVYVEELEERAHWGTDPATDPSLRMEAYIAAARRGATVRILLNSGRFEADFYDRSQNIAAAAYANTVARQERLDLIATLGDPTQFGIHNKMVLLWLDEQGGYVHLGSLNGGETANKTNRELALQIQSDEVFDYLKAVFDWDWYASNPIFLPLVARDWRPPEPPVGYPVISEVLYDPIGVGESDEWVEIFNPTSQALDLSGWFLGDATSPLGEFGSGLYTFPPGATLPPGGVVLIARQAADVLGFTPDFEFLIDPLRNDLDVPDMLPAGNWEGFGFALGNAGDEVILRQPSSSVPGAAGAPVDVLVYGGGSFPGVFPHPGVFSSGHSLERRPAIYDTDDCSHDFFDRYPPDPGRVSD